MSEPDCDADDASDLLRAEMETLRAIVAEQAASMAAATFELRTAINHSLADSCEHLPSLAKMAKGMIEQARSGLSVTYAHIPDRYSNCAARLDAFGQWIKLAEIQRLNPHLTFRDDGVNEP